MTEKKPIRKKIFSRINRIPADKLQAVLDFLNKIEIENKGKKNILSYAGTWSDMDEKTFKEFSNELKTRRKSRKERF